MTGDKRRYLCLLLWLLVLPASALEVNNGEGRRIRLETPAKRILALSPHAAELLFSAGAGGDLVGAVAYSDYPAAAKRVPRVGDAAQLDRERILALNPDLVIAWTSGNRGSDLAWLEKNGIPVYRSDPRRLEQIARDIEQIGRLAGSWEVAQKNASRFRDRLETLRRKYARRKSVSVFYQLWPQPLMTVSGDHIIGQVLRLCGGRNIFPSLRAPAVRISREAVILADPQVILTGAAANASDPLAGWRQWPSLQAVGNEHLYRVESDLIHRPTARILDGAEIICRQLDSARAAK